MDDRLESWVAAQRLIEKHGHFAAYDAARRRAADLTERGDRDLASVWQLVQGAILELRPGSTDSGAAGSARGSARGSAGRRKLA